MGLAVPEGYLIANPVEFGGALPGTIIKPGRPVGPTSYGDPYPMAFDVMISGGWVNVDDENERVALPAATLKECKIVFQKSDSHIYQLGDDLVTWNDLGVFPPVIPESSPQSVFSGNYGGSTPSDSPIAAAAIAYDLDSPFNMWRWNGSAWI